MTIADQDAEGARLADELAAEFGREEERRAPSQAPAPDQAQKPSRMPWVVAVVSLAVVLVQLPTLRASMAAKPSLRNGVQEIDAQTEACIDTLWAISALVQEGEPADALVRLPFAEPITRAAYVISLVDDEIVVDCPNPKAHGLKQLRITQSDPMPEAWR